MNTSGPKGRGTKPSPSNKAIARAAINAFGGKPKVERYWDEGNKQSVDMLSCQDAPCEGVTSYATIGLSDTAILKAGSPISVRTEFVGACASVTREFAAVLSTAAFCVINSSWFVAPGVIFPDLVEMFGASKTLKHVLFLPPFLWEDRLKTIGIGGKTIAWLLAIPISEGECRFAEGKGVPALEEIFGRVQIDIFDINRKSVVGR